MARRVYYRISDRPDGCFDAVVTIEPDTVIRREGFASLADVEDWIEGLRVLMAALGAPVAHADATERPADSETALDGLCLPRGLRAAR
ncbi:hypothetical protein MKK75_24255 [Methylobacterium sp. J-030]|uniref:hypothetical protein n=1 Tax=Methylobacterium sp. J-030 TaxID=2836627 RepID=UPI001FBB3CA7|nr:hypothetical protein [Methylobacterium sp. J-030]MCJ2071873.1 hypothetical protein [Methylobacterium sp. J-030]